MKKMKLKTLKDLSKVTIMVPDTNKKCGESDLIPKVYVSIEDLHQLAVEWEEDIMKEMNTEGSLYDVKYCDCCAEWIKYVLILQKKI